jgi:3-hydroxyisobutyrate dehydrogenase
VLGTKQPAEEAKLVIMASGPEQARDRVQPIFDAIGRKTMWLGKGGTPDLPYLWMKRKAILEHNFQPLFRLKLAAKDVALIEESARRHGLDLPLFSTIRERMAEAAKQHGDEDMSATYFASAPATAAA